MFWQAMFVARGKYLLFADADGASKFSDYSKLENLMNKINKNPDGMAVVCGSRAHLEQESIASVSAAMYFEESIRGSHINGSNPSIKLNLCVKCKVLRNMNHMFVWLPIC